MICPSVRTLILATLVISSFGLANAGTPPAVEPDGVPKRHNEATVAQLQAEMASGQLTSEHSRWNTSRALSRSINTGRASIR